jgi:hypothetical protein
MSSLRCAAMWSLAVDEPKRRRSPTDARSAAREQQKPRGGDFTNKCARADMMGEEDERVRTFDALVSRTRVG